MMQEHHQKGAQLEGTTNLIGQAMQRTSKAIHGSAEGQVGVRQGAAHQVAGVGADVASFMVAVRERGTTKLDKCSRIHQPDQIRRFI